MRRRHFFVFLFVVISCSFVLSFNLSESVFNYENLSFDKVSFCENYGEDSEFYDDYDGYCEVYVRDAIAFFGLSISLEYIYENKVIFNVDGQDLKMMSDGDSFIVESMNGEEFFIFIDGVYFSNRNHFRDYIGFKYRRNFEVPRSFCTGIVCTLYEDDDLLIDIYDIGLEGFCSDKYDCDIEIKFDGEYYEREGVEEGDFIGLDNITLGIMDIDVIRGFVEFNHSYRINDSFCIDSDFGENYSVFGNVTGFFYGENYTYGKNPVKPYVMVDYCHKLNPYLIEFYCSSEDYIDAMVVRCDNCVNGRCFDSLVAENFIDNVSVDYDNLSFVDKKVNEENSTSYPKREKRGFFRRIWDWLFRR
jgi:hypothetical protein